MKRVLLNADAAELSLAKKDMSKTKFAALVGCNKPLLSAYLAGKVAIRPCRRYKMQQILGLTFDELFVVQDNKVTS